MKLHHLKPAEGATKDRKRVGRGRAGAGGKTAGRGTKGTGARKNVPLMVGNLGPATFGRDDNALVLVDAFVSRHMAGPPDRSATAAHFAKVARSLQGAGGELFFQSQRHHQTLAIIIRLEAWHESLHI